MGKGGMKTGVSGGQDESVMGAMETFIFLLKAVKYHAKQQHMYNYA